MTEAQIQAAIDEINEILNKGITSTTVDGMTVSINHSSLRKRRAELLRDLDELQNGTTPSTYRKIQL